MNDILFAAFHDELEKMAVSARWLGSKLGTAPRLRDTSWDLGKGALGARQELYKQLKLQPGWSQVQARQVRERTQAQMQRIDDLFADKANRMQQKAPRVNANPKSIERGRAFAKEMDIIGEIRSNVLDPPTIRRAFETMPD